MSALHTDRLDLPERSLALIYIKRLSRPQGLNEAGRIRSMKNLKDPIGNPTRDLPGLSSVPEPTALPRIPTCRYEDDVDTGSATSQSAKR